MSEKEEGAGAGTVAVIEKKRAGILKEMTKETRAVAEEFEGLLRKASSGVVRINYDLGARLANMEDEAKYGSGAFEQLAAYLNIKGGATTLYALRQFASTFEKPFVEENMARTLTGGGNLQVTHWLVLSRIEGAKKRRDLLKQVFDNGWSAQDLEREVHAGSSPRHARKGGRKPGVPTSHMAGLQREFQLAQQFVNFQAVADKHVFDEIDEISPDKVNDTLLEKLKQTKETVDQAREAAEGIGTRLDTNIARVEAVLAEKEELAAQKAAEGGEEVPAKKKPAKKKPAAKKKASRKPAMAV